MAWSGDLDRIWPTLILSTTAAASGMEATGGQPRGMDKLKLSKLNFAGAGPFMMKSLARDNKVANPPELLELAQEEEPVGAATALLEMKEASVRLFI